MSKSCIGNCIICGKCAKSPILESFVLTGQTEPREGHGIAVDIGTTTVVMVLLHLSSGSIVARHSFMNPQRKFGADVISRIDAANKGHLDEMCCMIIKDIEKGIDKFIRSQNLRQESIVGMVVAGNTAMTHILLGFTCESLGVSPFKPVHKLMEKYTYSCIYKTPEIKCDLHILPWLGGFVGGDITAGLLQVLPMGANRFILIDLGTNGEMALFDNGRLFVAGTAAGPAFESGQADDGASGTINRLAQLVRQGDIDETGLLESDSIFTQEQIRNIQLAKSAIRSGLEILLEISGLSYDDIDAVYLAGGIGQAIHVDDAAAIGLIPHELAVKTEAVGNASLGGAALMLLAPLWARDEVVKLLSDVSEVNLATHPRFNEYFMDFMSF